MHNNISDEQIYELVHQNTIEDFYNEWCKLNLSDECFLIKVKDFPTKNFFEGINSLYQGKYKICSYFSNNDCWFIDNMVIENHKKQTLKMKIDYSFSFDSNICTLINAIMTKKKTTELESVRFISEIISIGYNYDFTFYLLENSKQIDFTKNYINAKDFWGNLNAQFRENVISLMKFKYIKKRKL